MNYKHTRDHMIECYPSLYLYEEDVLHHLFFTNGNGFEWKDGELIDRYSKRTRKKTLERILQNRISHLEEIIKSLSEIDSDIPSYFLKELAIEKSPDRIKLLREQETKRREDLYLEGYEVVCIENRIIFKIYPLCQYAGILTIPDNAKKNWLLAARKALELAPLLKPTESDLKWLAIAKERLDRFPRSK